MFKVNTPIRNAALDGAIALLDGNCEMRIYDDTGAVPTNASDAVGTSVLMCIVTVDDLDNPLGFGSAASGLVAKAPAEEWKGTYVAAGTPSFYRIVEQDDDDLASDVKPRLQGEIGLINSDLNLSSLVKAIDDIQLINSYIVGQPAYGS